MMPFNNNDEGIGASSWVNENASGTPLEILVKTNNELILSLHKQLAKTEQEINRKIENLRNEYRKANEDQREKENNIKEESDKWRNHVEKLLKEQNEHHQQDIHRYQDMLMDLALSNSSPTPPMMTPEQQVVKEEMKIEALEPQPEVHVEAKEPEVHVGVRKPAAEVHVEEAVVQVEAQKPEAHEVAVPVTIVQKQKTIGTNTSAMMLAPMGGGNRNGPSAAVEDAPTVQQAINGSPFNPNAAVFKPRPVSKLFVSTQDAINNIPLATSTPLSPASGQVTNNGANPSSTLPAKTNEPAATAGLFPANQVPQPLFGVSPFGQHSRANSVNTPTISRQPSLNFSANGNHSITGKGADSEKPQSDDEDGWKIVKPKDDNTSDKKVEVNDENKPPVDPNPNSLPAVFDEGEEIVFTKRVKLYRYVPIQMLNEERGIGTFKVLKDPRTGKFRCVMKPDDQEKPNADFPITGDMVLHKRTEVPVFTLACTDFSENGQNGKRETFSIRFRPQDAEEFQMKMSEFIRQSA